MINGKTQDGSPGSPFPPGVAAQITDPSPGLVWAASLLSDSGFAELVFASRADRRLAWQEHPVAYPSPPVFNYEVLGVGLLAS